jgi:hypothetical protein
MTRRLILAVAIVAVAAMPVPALARDGGHAFHGGRGGEFHGGHERFEHFHGVHPFIGVGFLGAPYAYYPYSDYDPYAYAYPVYSPPVVVEQPPVAYQPPAVQREVVYPTGKYVLYGDGVNQAYQWVWIPAIPPPPPPR